MDFDGAWLTAEGSTPDPYTVKLTLAAKATGLAVIDPTDIDGNCITAFGDFALMAITWLDDYTLTEPVAK